VYAPLTDALRQAMEALFAMRWPGVRAELNAEDVVAFRRLCLPDSPNFILDAPDYYALFTYTMFRGRVPGLAER
jgi:demethylmenaquinone methyltransferase/2-methoxy-6-polyprenyl-1,4-benzoquinol methylase